MAREALERTGEGGALAWYRGLENARKCVDEGVFNEQGLTVLAHHTATPAHLATLLRHLRQHHHRQPWTPSGLDAMIEASDQSPYAISDLFDAFCTFDEWLRTHQRPSVFSAMLGYLECCLTSQAATPTHLLPPLNDVLKEMLERFGYDGR